MKTITIKDITTTGLDSDFDNICTLDIDDTAFASGSYGKCYHCQSINGKPVKTPQVIKIFLDNNGSAIHSLKTIRALQNGLIEKKRELDSLNVDFLTYYPAFQGVPQFVFEGELEGDMVMGYSANNLQSMGYCLFKDVLENEDITDKYEDISLTYRFAKAYHLMNAFSLLSDMRYIHADFKADNFFVSLNNDGGCALIDFDSGVITNDLEDVPFTIGTPSQDMLAPELRRQLNEHEHTMVNLHTDIWSVAVACHYLLFLVNPFNFLTEISDKSVALYNDLYKWPDVSDDFEYYATENSELCAYLKEACESLPKDILECFRYTFTKGYFYPHFRTSYKQWCIKLKPYLPPDEARMELSKIKHSIDKKNRIREEQERKDKEIQDRLANMLVKPDDYPNFISKLILDLIRKETYLALHPELKEIGEQLGIHNLDKKVLTFMTTYYDIMSDDKVTETKKCKFRFLGRQFKMPESTIEKMLNEHIQ